MVAFANEIAGTHIFKYNAELGRKKTLAIQMQ